ncbi:hypothetical protein C8Q74DRAFT_1217528 [Fomes fomentarius]|nr:hypothetical protein C8Q74DRAFT_1217528 [Fomes fomentarius]
MGPDLNRLRSFLTSIIHNPRHAIAVYALRINTPVTRWELQRPTLYQRYYVAGFKHTHFEVRHRTVKALPGAVEKLVAQAFRLMSNLKELDFYSLTGYPDVVIRAGFALTELKTEGGALTNVRIAPTTTGNNVLRSLETLTLDLLHTCPPMRTLCDWPVRYLTLDNVPEKFRQGVKRSLPSLSQLVSLRIIIAACMGLDLWPTDFLVSGSFPALKRLELLENIYDHRHTYPPPPAMINSYRENITRLSRICPNLQTFVWAPSAYHVRLVANISHVTFRQTLPKYTTALFALLPSLEVWERPRLEDVALGGKPVWVAFTHGEDESLVDLPCQFKEEGWKQVD